MRRGERNAAQIDTFPTLFRDGFCVCACIAVQLRYVCSNLSAKPVALRDSSSRSNGRRQFHVDKEKLKSLFHADLQIKVNDVLFILLDGTVAISLSLLHISHKCMW